MSNPMLSPIVVAAAELFEKAGYDATTMAAIARRAGYSRQTLHKRYTTKAEVLAAIVDEFFEVLAQHILAWDVPPDWRDDGAGESLDRPAMSLVHAAHALLRRFGPVTRLAFAARNLPWLQKRVRTRLAQTEQVLGLHLGIRKVARPTAHLVLDALHRALEAYGEGADDDANAAATLLEGVVALCSDQQRSAKRQLSMAAPQAKPLSSLE